MLAKQLFLLSGLSVLIVQAALGQGAPAPVAEPPRAQPVAAQPIETPAGVNAEPAAPTVAGPQITFNSVHVEGPYIAMTFDDGPNAALTPKLLDMLASRHIKATFFVVGENAAEFPDILKRAVREGHEIANHSWSHPNLGKMGDDAVRSQMQRTDDAIKAAIGVRPTLMRPPYGSITARQKAWIHESFGYRIIIWDVDPLDWKRPGVSVVTSRIVSQTQPGSIVLAHDIHPPTIEAMPGTLDQLQEKGFKFVTVSELLALARPAPPKPPSSPKPSVRPPGPAENPAPAMTTPAPSRPNG